MSLRGFTIRLIFVAVITWITGAFMESLVWGVYFALLPVFFFEALRPR